jgi:2Fe-2S ferredoxin
MKVHVTLPDGSVKDLTTSTGQTLSVAMSRGGIPIRAECGGAMACATCHVVVDEAWVERVGPGKGLEGDLLDCSMFRVPHSRLSCQIKLVDELDGLKVTLQLDAFEG